ncbi:hypothetical protein KR009_004194 [Drosophila setifemur]|nr:hypothetical protein KR009_004194 [Drosophila setifemur]
MCRSISVFVVLWIVLLSGASSRTVFDQLFPGVGGYYYPSPAPAQPAYPGYYDSGYRQQQQQQRPRPQEHQRSYKDICRVVNTNGFTNPGGVPRCPY